MVARRLEDFPARMERTRENARIMMEVLASVAVVPPIERNWALHSYFLFAIKFRDRSARDAASSYLARRGVDSIRFYGDAPAMAAGYGYGRDCPVSESSASTILTVPAHARLTRRDLERITAALRGLGEAR